MICKSQFSVVYPCLVGFSNTYTRTSSKGKKHLVKKNRRKKLLIGAVGGLGVLGAIAYLAATRGKGKAKVGGNLTRQAQENLDRSKELGESLNDLKKAYSQQGQQLKNSKDELKKVFEKVKDENPYLGSFEDFDDFIKSDKTFKS